MALGVAIKRGREEAGFTLVEVMIAMIIMAFGMLTIAMAQLTAMRISTQSRHVSQAMYLAEQQMEAFLLSPPPVGGTFQDPGNPIQVSATDDDLSTYNRSWVVTQNVPRPGLTTVTINVLWNNAQSNAANAGRRSAQLQGILGP